MVQKKVQHTILRSPLAGEPAQIRAANLSRGGYVQRPPTLTLPRKGGGNIWEVLSC
jgi:hypothetical protein